jgi:uncharacterized DUF497 family protein
MFDWDDTNTDHVRRHGIEPNDVEEPLTDPRRLSVAAYNIAGEARRGVRGATSAGRVLIVVITKRAGRTRVITAYDADRAEKKRYRTRGK